MRSCIPVFTFCCYKPVLGSSSSFVCRLNALVSLPRITSPASFSSLVPASSAPFTFPTTRYSIHEQQASTSAKKNTLINLLRGWPSPHLLPSELLRQAANRALSDPNIFVPGLQYGPDPGYQPLREELARWLARSYSSSGSASDPEEICITGGASQSLAAILASFTDPGVTRAVWAAAPCYYLACPIFEDAGLGAGAGRLRAVKEDGEGVDVTLLEKMLGEFDRDYDSQNTRAKEEVKDPGPARKHYRHVIYLVTTCSNPSGKTLSLERRRRLVQIARKFDALVISDDVYDFLQWSTVPSSTQEQRLVLPRLSDIDIALGESRWDPLRKRFGHAVSNGSFSKLIGPGVRTGWVHASRDFVYGLSQTGQTRSGGAASQLTAAVIHQFMISGWLDEHIVKTVRPALQRRHRLIVDTVKKEMGADMGVKVVAETSEQGKEVFGGYFVWLELPEGVDAREVAKRAKEEESLVVAEGQLFEVAGDEEKARFPRNLRLSFSWEEEGALREGVERLGRVVRSILEGGARESVGRAQGEGDFALTGI
ncbi:pyridoxal phosphate-dependent transferase [Podospora australis]|uniref:Pyridoxal phosphate-dependent transferase n=1 Tax=Podospora australis TaxID=1536484 RepID=A0AAN6WT29_9PEZI|nr:pyridoxal phosphate-dependent transferase [Podospora australis]